MGVTLIVIVPLPPEQSAGVLGLNANVRAGKVLTLMVSQTVPPEAHPVVVPQTL